MFRVLPLAVVLIGTIWVGLTTHHLVVNRVGLGLCITFTAASFLLRSSRQSQQTCIVIAELRTAPLKEPRPRVENVCLSWRIAFRAAAGVGNDSVNVLPSTL